MVDRVSRLKLVIDATKAVASVERLNSTLVKLGATARSIKNELKNVIPGADIANAANKATSAIKKLAGALGSTLKGGLNIAYSGMKQFGSWLGGKFMGVLKGVANFIKNTLVEALRALTRNALRSLGLFAASLVHVQVEMDKFLSIMTLSTNSAKGGVQVFNELAAAANTFGLTLEGNLMKEFTKFRTVMVQAGLSGKQFMDIFGNFSQVANVFHLGSQDMQFAILALTQMVSKGKVSMEEMRRQLAERLPGTMQVAAKAFNTTTRELELAITKGFVNPVVLIEGMMEQFAEMTAGASLKAVMSMEARLGRLSNGFFEIKRVLLQSGVTEALVNFFEQVQHLINYAIDSGAVEKFGQTISDFGNKLLDFFSDTPRIKEWFSDFKENWGSIMMGAGMKFLKFFGEGLQAIAKDFWSGLQFKVSSKPVAITDGLWDAPGGEGSGKNWFQGLIDKHITRGMPLHIPMPVIEATYEGAGSTAFSSFQKGWQASFEQNAKKASAIGNFGPGDLSPRVAAKFKSGIRRAEAVDASSSRAVILSSLNQVKMLREETAQMLAKMSEDPKSYYGKDGAQQVLDLNVALKEQEERLQDLVPAAQKTERALSDLLVPVETDLWQSIDTDLKNLTSTISNDLVSGLMEGKFAFQDFANTIVESLMRVVTETLIVIPLMNQLRAAIGGGQGVVDALTNGGFGFFSSSPGGTGVPAGSTPVGGAGNPYTSVAGQIGLAEKGRVLSGGNFTAFAKGGLVNGPTLFKMKNGTGLMGEAGPEAIMPLGRDSQGRLGVRSNGGGAHVETNITIVSPKGFTAETQERENASGGTDTEVVFRQIEARIADRVSRRQGALFKTLQQGGHKGVLG